jgi:hypothetical protein
LSAPALLAELEAGGIYLTRVGDNLKVRGAPGVILAPALERIAAHKPALLKELLKRQIVDAVDVEPADFDRQRYDDLWSRYQALEAKVNSA